MKLFVHGGVSGLDKELPPIAHAVAAASSTSTALDAVERAVFALEDDPNVNAGFGAVLNLAGAIELDAGIADGATMRSGAVTSVKVRHPIVLARRVMETTPHVFMAGPGAMRLGLDLETMTTSSDEQGARWSQAREDGTLTPDHFGAPQHVDTVGAIALDDVGNLVAGSSTGGVFGKLPGRVGDACVFGAGFYASPAAAVMGTGVGELFIECFACARVGLAIESGIHPQRACEDVIEMMGTRQASTAGLIALNRTGQVGAAFRGGALRVEGLDGPVEPKRLA
ncbi:MAG: L-asparaginase / beta-aspartyl-peptidase [Actinomycetota bacterium]|jgi:beta-aspartyl-peptidase (threonine type)|nr:L-asparaginase / beta-aspartyl-peptidase [Actinomycetota bacterium]